jgi:hypothetical protein
MLAEAVSLEDFRDLRDMGEAARSWARARNLGIDAENTAAEYVLRAERGMGKALLALHADGKFGIGVINRPRGSPNSGDPLTVKDLGLTWNQSSVYQHAARLADAEFESLLTAARGKAQRIARWNFYSHTQAPPDAVATAERRVIREALAGDEPTSLVTEWVKVSEAMITQMGQIPGDERPLVASVIRRLYDAYVAAQS